MSHDQCLHGMARDGCASCSGRVSTGSVVTRSGLSTSRSKQRLLDNLCDLLGVARYVVTPGSSPSRVFAAAAARANVEPGSMPTIAAAIATKAGLAWGPECDNRRHLHEATMVTGEGVAVLTEALGILATRVPPRGFEPPTP